MTRWQKRLSKVLERSDVDLDDIRKAEEQVAEATARWNEELDAAADDDDDGDSDV